MRANKSRGATAAESIWSDLVVECHTRFKPGKNLNSLAPLHSLQPFSALMSLPQEGKQARERERRVFLKNNALAERGWIECIQDCEWITGHYEQNGELWTQIQLQFSGNHKHIQTFHRPPLQWTIVDSTNGQHTWFSWIWSLSDQIASSSNCQRVDQVPFF